MATQRTTRLGLPFAAVLLVTASTASLIGQTAANGPALQALGPAPQQQFVVYWTAEAGWHTDLMLRNNLVSQAITATPILRLFDGTEIDLRPVTVAPSTVESVNLTSALAQARPDALGFAQPFGSVLINYTSPSNSNLYASVMVHDGGHPVIFHLDGEWPTNGSSSHGSLEGIWWLPNSSATELLILSNTSRKTQQGTLVIYDADGGQHPEPVSLAPRQTLRLDVRTLNAKPAVSGDHGGISLRMPQGFDSVTSALLAYDESAGFAANMKMFALDPKVTLASRDFRGNGKWSTRAPMLALEHPDPALQLPTSVVLHPRLLLRNAAGHPARVSLALHWRDSAADGRITLADQMLAPYATNVVDIRQIEEAGKIPTSAQWAQVTLTSDGLPGEVLAVAASFDDSLRYGAQTPFSDQLASHLEGAAWQVDATHDSIIAAGNGSDHPVQAQLTSFYAGGAKKYSITRTIAADDQMWMDVGKLILNGVPDDSGNTLPRDLTTGAYRLLDVSNLPSPSLYEGKVVTDKTYGHATYGCMICCGYRGIGFNPIESYLLLGGVAPVGVNGTDTCGGGLFNLDSYAWEWWSDNTAILNVQPEKLSGIGVGATNANADLQNIIEGPTRYGQQCPLTDVPVAGPANVDNPSFSIAYSSYIPVDHVQVTGDGCSYQGHAVNYIFMGDAGRGTSRTYESITMAPAAQTASSFYPHCGQTREYAYGSPANGSTLSAADEDNVASDCYLWNAADTASSSGFTHSETYSTNQGQELFTGSSGNPLETAAGPITWNMRVLIDVTNVLAPTATVNYNHTCYPAHQVVVNGTTAYSYNPPYNSFAYIAVCLSGLNKVIGQTSAVPVPAL